MIRFLIRRLLQLPVMLIAANLFGYAFAFLIGPRQMVRNPYAFGRITIPPFLPSYFGYIQNIFHLNLGTSPNGESILTQLTQSGLASLGLLVISLSLSILIGLLIGFKSVKSNPPKVSNWVTFLSTIGMASPSFYIGILFITLSIFLLIYGPSSQPLLPFQGFGWDSHLILPVLALMVRPTVQIAHVTAGLLVEELGKQYTIAGRSFGHSEARLRGHAFRNILAPVAVTVSGSMRLLVAELIIIERLFNWPGFGRLLSTTLITTSHSPNYLNPPLFAALLTTLAALFLVADFSTSLIVRFYDPRLRAT